jgi:hypothetical protein
MYKIRHQLARNGQFSFHLFTTNAANAHCWPFDDGDYGGDERAYLLTLAEV